MRKNGGKITPRGKNVKHTYLAAKKTLKEVYVSVSLKQSAAETKHQKGEIISAKKRKKAKIVKPTKN